MELALRLVLGTTIVLGSLPSAMPSPRLGALPVTESEADLPAPAATPAGRATPAAVTTLLPEPAPGSDPVPARAMTAETCPASWFCYPRLGIAGPITPYDDCSGSTDVGWTIRQFTCVPGIYLLGHAYTQFGRITDYRVGDTAIVAGQSFIVTGAFEQQACAAPARPAAALSLQTSLTFDSCGRVLVVQGH